MRSVPVRAALAGAVPADTVSADTVSADTVPADTVPADAAVAEAVPVRAGRERRLVPETVAELLRVPALPVRALIPPLTVLGAVHAGTRPVMRVAR
ncbi:hypothetical protein AB0K67_39925 [Nonomuraea sp. NPDC052634]|uniref:hypothetical protein n=1 Tax=Nonomuraea sp. NPDC052634 TaxID=3155813 RepID=UPI00341A2D56